MGTQSEPGRRASFPWGLIGSIGLIVAVEWAVGRHALDFTHFSIHDWRVTGVAARSASPRCEVLCFGDSLVKFGIIPRVVAGRVGRPTYNLAVCGGQAASSYFLLRRALEAQARPGSVIVNFEPHLLAPDPRHNLRQWPELVDGREAIDLGVSTKHAGFFATLALGCVFPSLSARHEIRGNILAALRGESGSRRCEMPAYLRAWERDRGAMVCGEQPSFRGDIDEGNPGYFPRHWRCHPVNEEYICRFLDLAAREGIRVFWLLPPVTPRFQERRDELGLEASHDQFIRSILGRYPGVTVVDARRSGYDHTAFIDQLHLSRRGAEALSAEVAELIVRPRGEGPAGLRWMRLPPLRSAASLAEAGRIVR